MLIPYNTDAPLYHPPFATVGTILLNVLLFVPVFLHPDPYDFEGDFAEQAQKISDEMGLDEEDWEEVPLEDEYGQPLDEKTRRQFIEQMQALRQQRGNLQSGEGTTTASSQARSKRPLWRLLTLEFGKFRPWQWLTANYMHADLFHLLGNMFVLWGFGLVVEGKVGWWRFLVIYNAIGIAGWALVQFLTLFASQGIGLGASLAIFGILVVALVWAPANEMQCIFMFGLRPIIFEASITNIAIGAVFLQAFISVLTISFASDLSMGLRITSEVLHLIGGVFGLAVGIVMVKRRWVDCENWDMFSVMAGKHIRTREEDRADVARQLERIKKQEQKLYGENQPSVTTTSVAYTSPVVTNHQETLLAEFRSQVEAGKLLDAWMTFCRGEQVCFGWQVPEPDFVKYIGQLRRQKLWNEAATAMEEYLRRYFERETTIRLILAQVYVQHLNRPRDAWEIMKQIEPALLSAEEKTAFDKLRSVCKQRLAPSAQPPQI